MVETPETIKEKEATMLGCMVFMFLAGLTMAFSFGTVVGMMLCMGKWL